MLQKILIWIHTLFLEKGDSNQIRVFAHLKLSLVKFQVFLGSKLTKLKSFVKPLEKYLTKTISE